MRPGSSGAPPPTLSVEQPGEAIKLRPELLWATCADAEMKAAALCMNISKAATHPTITRDEFPGRRPILMSMASPISSVVDPRFVEGVHNKTT